MILRKEYHLLYGFVFVSLAISSIYCQEADSKSYDENDWIPIAPKHAPQSAQPVVENVEKKATGRVLNLAEPPANSFFPDEVKPIRNNNNNNFQQYLRETTTFQKVPAQVQPQSQPQGSPLRSKQQFQHPYKFDTRPTSQQQTARGPKPQNEFYLQQTPQQAQFVQYYQPHEYHTIPEEYLNQPLQQPKQQQQYFAQNFEIPDLPPIRLNATSSRFEKRPKPVQQHEITTKKNEVKDNVQLLYVPLESLSPQAAKRPQTDLPRLHAYQQAPIADLPPQFINYRLPPAKQQQIHNIQSDFAKQALDAHKLQLQFQQQAEPEEQYTQYTLPLVEATSPPTTTTTTRKPTTKKRKAHQPPLAVYMGDALNADVNDVLSVLKDAKSIDVQDSVGPDSPKIFVGPSNLEAPRGYAKFELPYLSSLDTNRVERKVDQYPFFVAPLSYKAPPGYSKIPLPSPHVGSVVIKEKEQSKPAQHVQNLPDAYQEYTLQSQPQIVPQFEYQQRPAPVQSSTTRYSKPIPEQHVINQHDIDQINSFIPQYNENVRLPESANRFQETPQPQRGHHNVDPYKSQTSGRPSNSIRFGSTAQPHFTEDEFIDEILHQQGQGQSKAPNSHVRQEEYVGLSLIPNQNEGQYLQEVKPARPQTQYTQESQEQEEVEEASQYANPQPTRTTHLHSPTRSRTTPAPASVKQYEEEVTKPTRIRTRPTHTQTHVRESYESPTRTTHLRSRPTQPPTPTTSEAVDQYHKETVVETRPRPQPTQRPTTEKPKYSIQEQFSIGRSTTPTALVYTPVAQEYEEEVKPHRPLIYKYKQSEDIPVEYQQPIYQSTAKPQPTQHQLSQEGLDVKVTSHDTSGISYPTGPTQQLYQVQQVQQEEYEIPDEQVRTHNANIENFNIAHAPQSHGHVQLPNLINNLEDQSVRQLLQPGLIPTSPKTGDVERYEISSHSPISTTQTPTSNYPSTHLPVIETTTQRQLTRGRVRGSRFTTTTPSSIGSSTTRRAPVTRGRRPLTSRTRYQEIELSTENTLVRSTTDPTKKVVTARSRFRTRGRPVGETTDRVSSAYDQVDVTPAHIQSSHVPSVQIIEPQVTQRINQEYINYRPLYNVPADQSGEPVLISSRKVTKPATEPVVIHQINQLPIKNLEEENTENTSSNKLRPRGRRPSTTAAPRSETSRKYEAETEDQNEDFYGFFREPTFKKPIEQVEPTEAPRAVYSSTYVSSTLKPLLRVEEEDVQPHVRYHSTTENVQFVGEIRPKYHTTAQYIEEQPRVSTERFYHATEKEVEEEKPRIRTRARLPTRTRITETSEKSNDEKTTTQRPRTRGKTHFRVPQKPKKHRESSEDEDVEGGNYPVNFKPYHTTPRPSFQITVDPQDDQEGYSSIYRPSYVAKTNNDKDPQQGQGHWVENYQMQNYIGSDGKSENDAPLALPSIATAPEVNLAIQEETEKTYKNHENVEKIVEEMIHEYEDNVDTEPTISIVNEEDSDVDITTTSPETTTQKRRRGVWKLIRRPVDVFEGAESQNAAANKNNLLETHDKSHHLDDIPLETHTDVELTTLPMTTITEAEATTQAPISPVVSSTTESGFFDSLYDMFGIAGDKTKVEAEPIKEELESITTPKPLLVETTFLPETIELDSGEESETETKSSFSTTTTTTARPPSPAEHEYTTPLTSMTFITPMSLETWNKGILKTSTSTEISHETEICYKGKCIKSKDMKVPMQT